MRKWKDWYLKSVSLPDALMTTVRVGQEPRGIEGRRGSALGIDGFTEVGLQDRQRKAALLLSAKSRGWTALAVDEKVNGSDGREKKKELSRLSRRAHILKKQSNYYFSPLA